MKARSKNFKRAILSLGALALISAQEAPRTLSSLRDAQLRLPVLPRTSRIGVIVLNPKGEAVADLPVPTLRDTADYFDRISSGKLAVEFSSLGSVDAGRTTAELAAMKSASDDEAALLVDAVRRTKAAGRTVLFLVPAKDASRDHFTWPHAGSLTVDGRRTKFVVSWATAPVGVHAHELGHLLGLGDDYEHKTDEEGRWCLMSLGYREGRPQGTEPSGLCAPCRVRLRWMERVTSQERRVTFDVDAALDVALPGGRVLVEWRGDRFLLWSGAEFLGEATRAKPLDAAGATLKLEGEGTPPVLAWEPK